MAKKKIRILDLFELREVKVSELKEWDINPRIHSEKGIEDVKQSISRLGMIAFLMADSDLTIVGGHARKKALIELGYETVNCWVAKSKLSERNFKVTAIVSNKIYSSFNQSKVNESVDAFTLLDWGFSASEVDFDDDGIVVDDDELDKTAEKVVSHKVKFSFRTESDRDEFEKLLIRLKDKYPDLETNGDRFIEFLKEEL